jgi:hypothetical protein
MNSIDFLKFMLLIFYGLFEIVSAVNSEEHLHLYFEEKAKPLLKLNRKGNNIVLKVKDTFLSTQVITNEGRYHCHLNTLAKA